MVPTIGMHRKYVVSEKPPKLTFYCDDARHLVCVPYAVENLHEMARQLGIKRCWFHARSTYPHYDIPKRRVKEITSKCRLVSARDILMIVKDRTNAPTSR